MEKKKKNNTEVEFFGYPSGDYEAFCFDVPKEVFIQLTGRKPDRFDKSYFNKKMYRLYLQDLIRMPYQTQCIFTIKMEVEPLEKKIAT